MSIASERENISRGGLFMSDFLTESIETMPEWNADNARFDGFVDNLQDIVDEFPVGAAPSESQTEDDLIWPVLHSLGWNEHLRQQNISSVGREGVPDGLLFENAAAKVRANKLSDEWKRYRDGLVVVESKRWALPLDRSMSSAGGITAPSSQMLRYLRRIDIITGGGLLWGILTNGAKWRLYFQGARSVSEHFFELDLARLLGLPGHDDGLFKLDDQDRAHWLKVFWLIFRCDGFVGDPKNTFHQRAFNEGRNYEARVADDLSGKVFDKVFPALASAIVKEMPKADMQEVRDGALILLYRILFILYAEDRNLLPVNDRRYDGYGLRNKVRRDIGNRKDNNEVFSGRASNYWKLIDELFKSIDKGDRSIGLPPYNGGLFDRSSQTILEDISIPDDVMADVIDALSFESKGDERKYINYRNLSVRQLGSIYERLLEYEVVAGSAGIDIKLNVFARKGSGSYYTPDDLVQLILEETIDPLIERCWENFAAKVEQLKMGRISNSEAISQLKPLDPASAILDLRICDPAMGSGHFLVSLVDFMADRVIAAMAEAVAAVGGGAKEESYQSPLAQRIEEIRSTIKAKADVHKWTVDDELLDDRHIIRRMVLKRCVYGVDKNPMAVELAKVSLWLHTFTVGAPLSFLDHHLRCGDSLFGSWVYEGIDKVKSYGTPLLLDSSTRKSLNEAPARMKKVEDQTDADIEEARSSERLFAEVKEITAPLDALLKLVYAFDWLEASDFNQREAIGMFLEGKYGDPFEISMNCSEMKPVENYDDSANKKVRGKFRNVVDVINEAKSFVEDERFLNWQVSFPGIWSDWEQENLSGGFDAVIGNPPWDKMKLQQVEWFGERRPEIANATPASKRKEMVKALIASGHPLAKEFEIASMRASTGMKIARECGDYPLLSSGDVDISWLFMERALTIIKDEGLVGLLIPTTIATGKTTSKFFNVVSTNGRLKTLYDFENGRQSFTDKKPFFENVHRSLKFCAFIVSRPKSIRSTTCAFYLHDVSELQNPDRVFRLNSDDFARINPNTGGVTQFRWRRDVNLVSQIYKNAMPLVDRLSGTEMKAWPVKYMTMFHMTNDSHLFRSVDQLRRKEKAHSVGGSIYDSASGIWFPLYEGKMIHQFDHRYASINSHGGRSATNEETTPKQRADPNFAPHPRYWVNEQEIKLKLAKGIDWVVAFREIASSTNRRTAIAAIVPKAGFGNKAPLLLPDQISPTEYRADLIVGNFNTIAFDFVARLKVPSGTLNLFIVEQFPMVPPELFETRKFGRKSAGQIVREIVLELTYTSSDLAPFARDMGYLDKTGNVKPPFVWRDESDPNRHLKLRAKLDALFFHLYGITDRSDIEYIYSTFPIVEREEREAHNDKFMSCLYCLEYMNALQADKPDADICI